MIQSRPRLAVMTACLLLPSVLLGCQAEDDSRAARVAHEALGVREKTTTTETQPRRLIVRTTEQVIDPETNEVLSEKVADTPVTVQVEIERQVKTDVGETRTATNQN